MPLFDAERARDRLVRQMSAATVGVAGRFRPQRALQEAPRVRRRLQLQ